MNSNKKNSYIKNNKQIELLIPGYPKGSNLTILNTAYVKRTKNEEGKLEKDYISILFRDNETGRKHVHLIYEPLYTFYAINESEPIPEYNLFFIEKEKVTPYTCKYADILNAIAEVTGRIQEFINNIADGNSQENRKLHIDTRIFMSDMYIENYYRFLFGLSYTNEVFKLSKGFMDIETDIAYCDNQFPEPGEVPINAIAYYDEQENTVFQLLYNDKRNPLVEQYLQSFQYENVYEQLHQFVINAVGGYKKAVKFGVDKLQYKILFFNDELELITKMFEIVNTSAPDFVEFWNMSFDMTFILARIQNLGKDPLDIICDKRLNLPVNFLHYYIDEKNKNSYEERGDYFDVAATTVWLDQMIEFASRRKGRAKYQSFKLDAIGEDVAGVRKLDYSHITNNIGMLPYLDMKTFSFYNIMDVIVQKCIEHTTQDVEYVFTKCLVNNTIYPKCHRQSVYLTNRFTKDFYEYGYIIGNNKNFWTEKPSVKFPGAMVGDPLHNSEKVMMHINGKPTMLSNNVVDFDYSSLYPSIILENNLAPNTQIGKILIEDPNDPRKSFSLNEHPDMYSSSDEIAKYSRGGEFLENLMSGNPLEFGRRWMGLGDVYDVIDDIKEYYRFNGYIGRPIDHKINESIYFVKGDHIEALEYYTHRPSGIIFDSVLDLHTKEQLIDEVRKGALL